jgi:hypothetical protein
MTTILRGFPQSFQVDACIFLDGAVTAFLHILRKSSLTQAILLLVRVTDMVEK